MEINHLRFFGTNEYTNALKNLTYKELEDEFNEVCHQISIKGPKIEESIEYKFRICVSIAEKISTMSCFNGAFNPSEILTPDFLRKIVYGVFWLCIGNVVWSLYKTGTIVFFGITYLLVAVTLFSFFAGVFSDKIKKDLLALIKESQESLLILEIEKITSVDPKIFLGYAITKENPDKLEKMRCRIYIYVRLLQAECPGYSHEYIYGDR